MHIAADVDAAAADDDDGDEDDEDDDEDDDAAAAVEDADVAAVVVPSAVRSKPEKPSSSVPSRCRTVASVRSEPDATMLLRWMPSHSD